VPGPDIQQNSHTHVGYFYLYIVHSSKKVKKKAIGCRNAECGLRNEEDRKKIEKPEFRSQKSEKGKRQ